MRGIGGSIRIACLGILATIVALAAPIASPVGASIYEGGYTGGSLMGNPLVVPGAETFLGGQQASADAAKRANPLAALARQRSRGLYAHLAPTAVPRLLAQSFPSVIAQPAGGTPSLPPRAHVVAYRSTHAIQIALPGHQLGIVESASPIAKRSGHGEFKPIDLNLRPSGAGYAPVVPETAVLIPRQLSAGVSIPANGVSLSLVDAHGRAASAQGVLDHASVVYPAVAPATDAIAKPTANGFQLDAALRSAQSPQRLYFKVGAPRGARLVQDRATGTVHVVTGKSTIAAIMPPAAEDSAETTVPVSMHLAGRTVVVEVDHRAGSYLYPIDVDPEVNDSQLAKTSAGKNSNWQFATSNSSRFQGKAVYEGPGKEHLETKGIAAYVATEWAFWGYETKGNSKIYELKTKTSAKNIGSKIESFLEFEAPGGTEKPKKVLSTEGSEPEYSEKATTICAWNASKVEECLPAAGKEKNAVHFQQSATASPGNFGFFDTMSEGIVSISEPTGTHSTTSYNTTSPELEFEIEGKMQKRKNALYGSGVWLSKFGGALQMNAADPGIGVAKTKLEYESSSGVWTELSNHEYLEKENLCQGVQCYASHSEYWTLDPKLPDGERNIRYRAEEAMSGTISLESEGKAAVKVDATAPHSLHLLGLPFGDELSEKPYELTGEATDGEGTTVASSGIKSIALYIDGSQFGTSGGACSVSKGECTGSYKWTVNGAELGSGHHAIALVVLDNAGNESRLERTISIRHSTPVALGPGSVDLESGDFALGATDVSLGSGLEVSRNYSSRNLTQGKEGSLGLQWSVSLADAESLVEMVDGGVILTDANGEQSIFSPIGGGKFEAPIGDSNLALTLEENEAKEKLSYTLTDAAKHTSVKFTQTAPGTAWLPTKQEGTVATDTVTYKYQGAEQYTEYAIGGNSDAEGIVTGPDGNVWYANGYRGVGKMTPYGVYTEYAFPAGSFALDITVGPDNNLWVTEWGTSKIGKITTTGAITEYALPANSKPEQIVTGPDGNLWFTEYETNKIGKITTSGTVTEYSLPASSHPFAIGKGPDGNIWFSENGTGKIAKITTSGTITEFTKMSGTEPRSYGIVAGPDGNVWFTKYCLGCAKVVKMTTSGTMTEYALGSGATPRRIVVGPDKNLWTVSDGTNNKVIKVTTEGTIKEFAVPTKYPWSITTGPDGNMWYAEELNQIGVIPTSGVTVEPLEALAPKPSGVSCEPELKAGCRALKFKYASETTTTGEASSEWGQFRSRLSQVLLDAYDPVTKAMRETAVAEYVYDKLGRLRAEWDPRISPALKTTYGYDQEGHVTALTPPGEESWAFTYGTIAGDAGTGRLLKAARAPASASLWGGELVKNTAAPSVSGSATTGVRMAVTDGTWSGSPVLYGYQWEDCNSSGLECVAIPGANNANYTPVAGDVGHKLVAVVSATNGGGSVGASSAASATVVGGALSASLGASSLNAVACVPSTTDCVVSDSNGNAYYATNVSASSAATWKNWTGPGVSPSEALACPTTSVCLMADGNKNGAGSLYYATSLGGSWTLAYNPSYGVDAISCVSASFCVDGQDNFGYFRYSTNPPSTSWTLESQGSAAMKGVSCLSSSFCAIVDGAGSVHAATTTVQVESSSWTSTNVDGTTALNGVACVSTTSCVAVDNAGNVLSLAIASGGGATVTKHNIDGTNPLTAISCPTSSECVTVDNQGNVFLSTNGGGSWSQIYQPGGSLTSVACASSTLCVTVDTTGKVTTFNPTASTTAGEARTPQLGMALEYGVSLAGGSGLLTMTENEVAKWGQQDDPVEATAIVPPDARQGWPASSYTRATVYYLDEEGRTVNVSKPSTATYGSIATSEYSELNDVVRTLSPNNRQKALEAGSESVSVAKSLSTYFTYKDECSKPSENNEESESTAPGSRLCETEGPQHMIKYVEGSEHRESLARLHTKYFYDEKAPGGETYNLKTRESSIAELANEEEREVRKTTFSYSGQSNLGWKLRAPTSVTADPEGKKLTTTTVYNATTGQIAETRSPLGGSGESPRDKKIIYYSAEANTEGYTSCGSHPEWAGLVCETLPAKQPEAGTPALPVIVVTAYNMWNEPETTTETFGSTVRTKKQTYDSAERLSTSETTSTANIALPKVTNEYNTTTGALEKQSTTVEAKTKTITSKYNKLGQITEYTDADGNTAKYTYGGPENDWLLEEISDGSGEGTGRQVYSYDATTKHLEKLWDSAAGTFTASYDAEGKITSEVYPNAMCANTAYNSVGEATHVEYIKTSNCSETGAPVWYTETRSPSVRGETYDRTSTLANESYFYDSVGRPIETQETPAGEGCSVRLYAYDNETNRTSQTTRVPGVGGKCATEGGTVLAHTYDEANRLKDAGVTYDAFGNVTKLPAADAEGHELASTFYVDNAVATQSQNGVTNNYYLDPEGRVRETVTGATTVISHYDGPGESVEWTSEGTGKGTRNIPGIDGTLSATQTNGGTPVLQLHDLQGDIVATASLSSEATKVLSTYNSTEFGVPNGGAAPPKYAWLGATDVASAFSSGVITYGSTSYVPQTGRALQSEQVEPPGLPGGSGGGSAYISQMEPWNMQGAAREGAEAPGLEAAREQAAMEAAWAAATDPLQVHYMNKTKARALAKELWALSKAAEVAEALEIPLDWVEAAVGAVGKIPVSKAIDWLVRTSEMMSKCGNSKWSVVGVKANICKLEYSVLDVGGVDFIDFTKRANVFVCLDNSGKTCFHQVFPDPPQEEIKCAFGLFCIAVIF